MWLKTSKSFYSCKDCHCEEHCIKTRQVICDAPGGKGKRTGYLGFWVYLPLVNLRKSRF